MKRAAVISTMKKLSLQNVSVVLQRSDARKSKRNLHNLPISLSAVKQQIFNKGEGAQTSTYEDNSSPNCRLYNAHIEFIAIFVYNICYSVVLSYRIKL